MTRTVLDGAGRRHLPDVVSEADPWTAWILRDLYARVAAGSFSAVSSAVEQVTGRPARTVEQFVDEYVDHWH